MENGILKIRLPRLSLAKAPIKAIACLALLASAAAQAQTLQTTITVDRVVEPELRQATRPAWAPQLLAFEQQDVRLTPAEYTGQGTLLSCMTPLPPLMWGYPVERTPYRGYASLGYFPAVNLGANAGYRFIDTESSALGAWMQYNGNQYTRLSESNDFSRDVRLRSHTVSAGAYGSHHVGSTTIDGGIDYTHAAVLRPSWTRESGYNQGTNEVNARLAVRSRSGRLGYGIAARYQYFGFNDSDLDVMNSYGYQMPTIRQSLADVRVDLDYLRRDMEQPAKFEMGIEWQFLHTADYGSVGLIKLHPRFNIGTGAFRSTLGLKAFVTHDTEYISYLPLLLPDVRLSWAPASLPVGVYANCLFDSNFTPVADIFAIDPYVSSRRYFLNNITLRLECGVNLGAFRGFSARAYVAQGVAANNPTPYLYTSSPQLPVWASPYGGTQWVTDDQSNTLIGLRLSYAYSSLAEATLTCEHAFGHNTPRWYQWLDGAHTTLRAHFGARPMPRLSVYADYELRAGRAVNCCNSADVYDPWEYSLGDANLLTLGGSYDLNPRLTLFLRAENLLNSRYLLISALPAQGIRGLAGATLKF